MRILHYSLGLPPYRSGGLTKYSTDLMKEQAKNNDVFLLFPGEIKIFKKDVYIRKYKEKFKIKIFELKNPQSVSLLNGINDVSKYTKKADKKIFRAFLLENSIDIIHIHTLMGLYIELLEVAKELGIKVLYTTHDYFGLCPNPNFLDGNGDVVIDRSLEGFNKCNINPLNSIKINILQSVIYREIKNYGGIKLLKKYFKRNKYINKSVGYLRFNKQEYELLKKYYDSIFNNIDMFLFNSTISYEVFGKFIDIENKNKIINITHSDIKDNRKVRKYYDDGFQLTYMGPFKKYKGFYNLIKIANNLKDENIKFKFYGDEFKDDINGNIDFCGKYKYSDLENIFSETDLLVVPSIWYETFGFIVAEAISFGVPVITTDKVGAKDILKGKGIVSDDIEKDLRCIIKNRNILKELNNNIVNLKFDLDFIEHNKKIVNIYKEIKGDNMGKLNVIGLGYIGLPTALMFAANGIEVVGSDFNKNLVDTLNNKQLTFKENGLEELFKVAINNNIKFQTEYIKTDKYIITVPTPYIKESKKIDPKYVIDAFKSVLNVCEKGAIVIIESTVSPGTIEKYIRPIIKERGLINGVDINLVHAPERIIPGNMIKELKTNSRTLGADCIEVGKKVKEMYESFCEAEIILTDIKTAELSKVVENTFRDINIAFANELAQICDDEKIDVYELIRIANKHPRVNILQPGPGVGGHCISVDPWFLVGDYPDKVNIIKSAREVNDSMPKYVLDKIKNIMKENEIYDFSKVGIYGLTYKENVDDMRESPTLQLLEVAKRENIYDFKVYDPMVGSSVKENNVEDFTALIKEIKLLVILVAHDEIKSKLSDMKDIIIYDTRNITKGLDNKNIKIYSI